MALWMAYAVAVSLLLAGAALAAEKGLDAYGKPTRWPWVVALVGSVALPLLAYLVSSGWLPGGGTGAGVSAGAGGRAPGAWPALPLLGAEVTPEAATGLAERARSLDPWLLAGCVAAPLAVAGWLLVGWLRLRRSRRGWRRREIGGVRVLVSPDQGPAVTGLLRGTILLPAWFEELDRDLRRLVLRHEREHLTSGDHRLWAAGLATVVLFAWNPVLWWGLSRLRQAMEIDCDRRVLARGVNRATYGELLVHAGHQTVGSRLSPASFAASRSLLERRIRRLTTPAPGGRAPRAALAVTAVAVLGLAGGWLPVPSETVTVGVWGEGTPDLDPAATSPRGDAGRERVERRRVVPPVPAVMRLDLRLYRRDPGGDGAAAEESREVDVEAVRLARRLTYACSPYLGGAGGTGKGSARRGVAGSPTDRDAASRGGTGCLVVMDGRRVEPSALWGLGPGAIERIDILPAEEATERFGPDGRQGAYLIRTGRG